MEWELFSDRIRWVPSSATDEAGALPYPLSPGDAVLTWQNFLKNPTIPGQVSIREPPVLRRLWFALVVLVCGLGIGVLIRRHGRHALNGHLPTKKALAIGLVLLIVGATTVPRALSPSYLSDAESGEVLAGLLENIYGAFDYREESMIYDILARSASGDLLTEIYLETRRSLELENQGGARAKVQALEMLEARQEPLAGKFGFVAHCRWNVAGSVGHWGHIHQRVNQYAGRFTVEVIDGVWKITGLELLEEARL